uniref:G-protein coupled receptors family 1 profile domain-containing protein n=1 Tax=Varanus komodoensis TaxID=61221 RepID=A0A8D2LHZ3_VARKO
MFDHVAFWPKFTKDTSILTFKRHVYLALYPLWEGQGGCHCSPLCLLIPTTKTMKSIYLLDGLVVIICIVGPVGNGIVIRLLGFHFKRKPFTTYVLNLAVADSGFLLITVTTQLKMSMVFLFLFAYTADLCLLTAINVERCLSVCFPIWYRCDRPRFISILASFMIWFMSMLFYGITMIFFYDGIPGSSAIMIRIISTGNIFFLGFLMVISTLIRFTRISFNTQDQQRILWVTLPLTIILFLCFAIPVSIFYFMDYFCYSPPPMFMLIGFLLISFNSTVNPLIYYVIGGQWKRWKRRKVKAFQNALRDEGKLEILRRSS